ncbi:hypothetical protein CVT25_001611 [Psilocybe cyanescens]|uniref:Uncharacterized protein n=1 Tax=Psilocybe cyanescens TaxID=93625 RepID=A0A409WQ04_PSICY|nr:hypothetical protein CVT25_001611 [Psilocybe cyanescens]
MTSKKQAFLTQKRVAYKVVWKNFHIIDNPDIASRDAAGAISVHIQDVIFDGPIGECELDVADTELAVEFMSSGELAVAIIQRGVDAAEGLDTGAEVSEVVDLHKSYKS